MSSLAEIRQAIEKLAAKERSELRNWLDAQDIEESPEFLAAVDEGIRSAESEPKSSLEDVMKRLQERFGWKLCRTKNEAKLTSTKTRRRASRIDRATIRPKSTAWLPQIP